jgi:hypothetical protein
VIFRRIVRNPLQEFISLLTGHELQVTSKFVLLETQLRSHYHSSQTSILKSVVKMVENKSLILAKSPVGLPVVGQDLVVTSKPFDVNQAPPEGGLILKTNYVSYDPYLRGRSQSLILFDPD